MSSYGRTSSNAIAIAALLAERYEAKKRTTSQEAAKIRGISKPLAARILVQLSQVDLVAGTPGPNGGYALARAPQEIRLSEIVSVFQKVEASERCAYGPGWCGTGKHCPLHDHLTELDQQYLSFLEKTTLDVFEGQSADSVAIPEPPPKHHGRSVKN
ncbi:MAG: Rrf2 family transcriptional regulator [Fibrobacterota bacterium]